MGTPWIPPLTVEHEFRVGNSYWNYSLQRFCESGHYDISYAGRTVTGTLGEVVVISPKDKLKPAAIFVFDKGTENEPSYTRVR